MAEEAKQHDPFTKSAATLEALRRIQANAGRIESAIYCLKEPYNASGLFERSIAEVDAIVASALSAAKSGTLTGTSGVL